MPAGAYEYESVLEDHPTSKPQSSKPEANAVTCPGNRLHTSKYLYELTKNLHSRPAVLRLQSSLALILFSSFPHTSHPSRIFHISLVRIIIDQHANPTLHPMCLSLSFHAASLPRWLFSLLELSSFHHPSVVKRNSISSHTLSVRVTIW